MSCQQCNGSLRGATPAPKPSTVWPFSRTAFDNKMQSKWGNFCMPNSIPTINEGYSTTMCPSFPERTPYFHGNMKLALGDIDNPLSYTQFRM